MNRSTLGPFGSELLPEELGPALAAAGVFLAQRAAPPRGRAEIAALLAPMLAGRPVLAVRLPADAGAAARDLAGLDAWELAEGWQTAIAGSETRPRLAVALTVEKGGPPRFDGWLLRALATPHVGAGSVFFELDGAGPAGFSWPLRLGFLGDAGSRALRDAFVARGPHPDLWNVVPVTAQVDLLVVPHSLRGGLQAALQSPGRERAHCVLVLGGLEPDALGSARFLVEALQEAVATDGIAVLDVPAAKQVDALERLVVQISHDLALDEALFAASRDVDLVGGPPPAAGLRAPVRAPLLLASRPLVQAAHLSTWGATLAADLEALPRTATVPLPAPAATRLGLPSSPSAGAVAARVRDVLRGRFGSERGEARDLAELARASVPGLESVRADRRTKGAATHAKPPAAPRRLRAQVLAADGARDAMAEALRRGQRYLLSVSIGAKPLLHGAAAHMIFPQHLLSPSSEGHDLTVVFAEDVRAGERADAQVATLHLPPEDDSAACVFPFRVRDDATGLGGRVTVLYRNRVLQTAHVEARVATGGAAAVEPLDLRIEVFELERDVAAVEGLPPFEAAVVFHETGEGAQAATGIAGDLAVIASLGDVDGAVRSMGDMIASFTDRDRGPDGLPRAEMAKLLIALANPGKIIWDQIEQVFPEPVRRADRLQLVQAKPGRPVPVELLYRAIAAPLDGAEWCAGGPREGNRPCAACPVDFDGASQRVCPNQFWGLRSVFERQARSGAVPPGAEATLREDRERPEARLQLKSALLVTSDLVDAHAPQGTPRDQLPSAAVRAALDELVGADHVTHARSLVGWKDAIAQSAPELIVLVVHTTADAGGEALQLGESQKVRYGQIDLPHVRGSDGPHPLVLVIGCSTAIAASSPSLELVPRLMLKGASAVVATLSPILGRYAAPATAKLLRALNARRQGGPVSLGEALLGTKCKLLEEGEPIGLSLVSFGDVDLVL